MNPPYEARDRFRFCLIGANRPVAEMCRASLDRLCAGLYELQECTPSDALENADVYIWDADSGTELPGAMARATRAMKLVVVSKPLVSSVQKSLPSDDFVFLHNPVTPLTMRVFLESAVARLGWNNSDETSSDPVFDRDRILQELLETNLKLQEHDEDRTNFLTRAVHDIRVPLTAVQGYCGLLLAGQLGNINPEQARVLRKMQRSLTRLDGLATAITDLSTRAGVRSHLNLATASIEACVDQAVHEILPLAEQKHIQVTVDLEPPSAPLLVDSGQIEQVVVNLLDNGCKFTPRHGSIEVRGYNAARDGQTSASAPWGYRIDISDNGPGIPVSRLDDIFREYTSCEGPIDRSGMGLGLAICRTIVDAHGGRIWADSEGRGAKFSVILPYVRTQAEEHGALRTMNA